MSILDNNGDHIVTMDGIWSVLLKVALVTIPGVLAACLAFGVWIITEISSIRQEAAVMRAEFNHLANDRPPPFFNPGTTPKNP